MVRLTNRPGQSSQRRLTSWQFLAFGMKLRRILIWLTCEGTLQPDQWVVIKRSPGRRRREVVALDTATFRQHADFHTDSPWNLYEWNRLQLKLKTSTFSKRHGGTLPEWKRFYQQQPPADKAIDGCFRSKYKMYSVDFPSENWNLLVSQESRATDYCTTVAGLTAKTYSYSWQWSQRRNADSKTAYFHLINSWKNHQPDQWLYAKFALML